MSICNMHATKVNDSKADISNWNEAEYFPEGCIGLLYKEYTVAIYTHVFTFILFFYFTDFAI
jgi:hypothetical protein